MQGNGIKEAEQARERRASFSLLESIRPGREDISPHHVRYSLEVTGRDNRGGCTEKGGDKRVCANRGNGAGDRCGTRAGGSGCLQHGKCCWWP